VTPITAATRKKIENSVLIGSAQRGPSEDQPGKSEPEEIGGMTRQTHWEVKILMPCCITAWAKENK
jgi:hypothetical protein